MFSFIKKRPSVGSTRSFKSKQQDVSLMVSPIVAQLGCKSNSTSVSVPLPKHKVCLTGVDTLVITAGGNVSPSKWLVEHQSIWNEYQQQQIGNGIPTDALTDEIGGHWWSIRSYGVGQYKYVLDNPEVGHIRIWNTEKWSSAVKTKQHVYLDLRSSYLHQFKSEELVSVITNLLSNLFDYDDPSQLNLQISRVDLHTDITNGNAFLTESQINNTISRSKYRNYFVADDTITFTAAEREHIKNLSNGGPSYNKSPQKLIDTDLLQQKMLLMIDKQNSFGADNIIHKREIETAYFGKKNSDVWGKVYDKTKCCKAKSDLDTPLLWLENGWNKTDTIIRCEFSMRRAFIKEMNNGDYVSLQSFIDNINNVWVFLTTKWMRMVDEVKHNNIQTSPISQFWLVVQQSFTQPTNNIVRKRNLNGKVNQLIKQGLGCLKQAVAKGMLNNDDDYFNKSVSTAVSKCLSSSYHNGELHQRRLLLGLT